MLDIIHLSTRLCVLGESKEDVSLAIIPEGEKKSISKISKISIPGLTRAWQILLKGIEEVRSAPNPDEAGSMVLIRLGYASDLPDPSSLVKKIKSKLEKNSNQTEEVLNKSHNKSNFSESNNVSKNLNLNVNETSLKEINTFEDLVDLFKIKGELLLHAQLLSCIHLVSFERGKLEVSISGNVSNNISYEISKFLKNWTGQDWIVSIVDDQGTETLERQNERKSLEEIEKTKKTPEMQKVLKAFPNADLKSVIDTNR